VEEVVCYREPPSSQLSVLHPVAPLERVTTVASRNIRPSEIRPGMVLVDEAGRHDLVLASPSGAGKA
jgi:hypothetical protein